MKPEFHDFGNRRVPESRYYLAFKVVTKDGQVVDTNYMSTPHWEYVSAMQLAQKLREMFYQVSQFDETWPLVAEAWITNDTNNPMMAMKDSPKLRLSCRITP